MKKLLLPLVLAFSLFSCDGTDYFNNATETNPAEKNTGYVKPNTDGKTHVKKLELTESSITLDRGDVYQITCSISPTNAVEKMPTWVSSDPSVVEIAKEYVYGKQALFTAKKVGRAIISATITNEYTGEEIESSCEIVVKDFYGFKGEDGSDKKSFSELESMNILSYDVENGLTCNVELFNELASTSIGSGKLFIDNKVTKIANDAFVGCRALSYVELPKNVVSIGDRAFKDCENITEIIVNDNLTTIGSEAFANCQLLKEFEYPNKVERIEEKTFASCLKLKSISLSKNINYIDPSAFEKCSRLDSIIISEENTTFGTAKHNCIVDLETKKIIKGSSGTIIPSNATVVGNSSFAFLYNLKVIDIPKNITSIEEGAFLNCIALQKLTFNDGLVTIDKDAFRGCLLLDEIVLPSTLTTIEESAFEGCAAVYKVVIPASVTKIGKDAFKNIGTKTIGNVQLVINYLGTRNQWEEIRENSLADNSLVVCKDDSSIQQ